jgi:hypothetical protein
MFVRFDDNPNCGFTEDRVWKEQGQPRGILVVLRARDGKEVWCAVTGVDDQGKFIPALGIKVEDSGEGTCWLIYGGRWGLRFAQLTNDDCRVTNKTQSSIVNLQSSIKWSLDDAAQWAEPFLLLPPDGQDIRFA